MVGRLGGRGRGFGATFLGVVSRWLFERKGKGGEGGVV